MKLHARAALGAVFVVGSALAAAQSRPHTRRPNCPSFDTAVSAASDSTPSPLPYGGAALAVGGLGIASRIRRGLR